MVSDRQQRHTRAQNEFNYLQVFLRLGLGVVTAVLSFFLLDGKMILLPVGLLVSGIIWAMIAAFK